MSETRRAFLQSTAFAGLSAAAASEGSEIQVPSMKFGGVHIGRLVAGCNPFYGFAHYNNILASVMKDYYTPERICEVLHECNRCGINAYNWVDVPRARQDLERFRDQGGRMHLIVQGIGDVTELCKAIKPLAIYHHGERTDTAWQGGQFQSVKEWCKRTRDLGV